MQDAANGYQGNHQNLDFLSFREFLETIPVSDGREVTYQAFRGWFDRYRKAGKLSWANVKTLFYRSELLDSKQVIHILHTNYRNSGEITASAYNRHLFARMSHGYYALNP